MKKKKIVLFVFLIVGVLSLVLTYNKKIKLSRNKPVKEEKLSIMIKEDGATDYTKSNSKDIPKGDYVLNKEKSYCKNNGKIEGYDSTTGTVSFAFIGTDRCFLYFDFKQEKIIIGTNELVVNSGKPDFTKVATTNEGIYKEDDDFGTSYYFRGAVDNNWVKFGEVDGKPIYWRIIRINGDGSIRMIYTGTTAPTESQSVVMTGGNTQISSSKFMESQSSISKYSDSGTVGFQYRINIQHAYGKCDGSSYASCSGNGLIFNSYAKSALDSWYTKTNLNSNETIKNIVTDAIYCNDRSASVNGINGPYGDVSDWSYSTSCDFGSLGRISKNKSSLKCPDTKDKFTVSSSIGNGALTYPVGLITADEVFFAGLFWSSSDTSNYLYTGQDYWTISPRYSEDGDAYMFVVTSRGSLQDTSTFNDESGVRPVISISKNAIFSGDGTWNNPYIVEN